MRVLRIQVTLHGSLCSCTLYIVLVLFEKFLLESFPPNIQNILRYFFRWKLVLELAYCNVYISSIQGNAKS